MIGPSMGSSFPFVITTADFRFVWKKYRQWLVRIGVVGGIVGGLVSILTPAPYTAKALLRESGSSGALPSSSSLSSLFLSSIAQINSEGNAIVVIRSDQIMRRVIQDLGLQMHVRQAGRISTLVRRGCNNLLLFCGNEPTEQEPFLFTDVQYVGRKTLQFFFSFRDENHFLIHDQNGALLAESVVGEKVLLPEVSFSLLKPSSTLIIGKQYPLSIHPWEKAAAHLRNHLEVRIEKLDKSLMRLFYSHPNRRVAIRTLDGVMAAYMDYLQEENNRIAEHQLTFLDQRQKQFINNFDKELDEYLVCLQDNIQSHGFFEVEQEVELLTIPQKELKAKLMQLDSLFDRLKKVQFSYNYAANHEDVPSDELHSDILPAHDSSATSPVSNLGDMQIHRNKLKNREFGKKDPQDFYSEQATIAQKQGMSEHENAEANTTQPKTDSLACFGVNREEQFAGIDLETAQKLHVDYQRELDSEQEKIDTFTFLLSRIHNKDFDLNALGALANDQVIAKLASIASELALQSKDIANRSQRDLVRIEESLAVQKNFIADHLSQSLELYKQNAHIARQKLSRLREVMMKLVEAEKTVIYKKLHEIRDQLGELPERWKLEKQLELRSEVAQKIVEGITQMMEGKTIEHRLKLLNSKVIDVAHTPILPTKMPFLLFVGLFMGAGLGLGYMFFFCCLLLRGFPLSEATARALELSTCGTLGRFCDGPLQELPHKDLETLRALANFIQTKQNKNQGVVIGLIGGRRPSYLYNLTRLLAMRNAQVLIVDACFDFAQSEPKEHSLWDYLTEKNATWTPHTSDGFDILYSGATGRFCSELLHKERFAFLLAEARDKYDIVLFISSSAFVTSEVGKDLEITDALIITMQEETLEQLERTGLIDRFKHFPSATVVFQEARILL